MHGRTLAIIGLGYVGLPVATAFARSGVPVIGFDIDHKRVDELRAGHDRTREVEPSDLSHASLSYESDPAKFATCDFFIVAVPSPIDKANRPDLGAILAASQTVGEVLKRGDVVVYSSTVYPGAVEEDCAPLLEKVSGLKGDGAALVGFLVATNINLVLSRLFTFPPEFGALGIEALLVTVASGLAFAANLLSFLLLYRFVDVNVVAAKMAGTTFGFAFNYVARQFVIFSRISSYLSVSAVFENQASRHIEKQSRLGNAPILDQVWGTMPSSRCDE